MELRENLEQSVWNPTDDVSNYKLVEPNDFVIGLRSFQHGFSSSSVRGLVSPAYTVFRPGLEVDHRYYKYYFRSARFLAQLANIAQGIRQGKTIDFEDFANLQVPLPDLQDQRRIADFLDGESSRIDGVVKSRRKQMALLEEREYSRIFHAIRGAAERGHRRHSGVGWLGDVPVSWPVLSVTSQFEVLLGKMLNQERARGDHLKPYLRNTNVQWDRITTEDLLEMNFPPHERQRYLVRAGDLLICEGGQPGRSAIWDGSVEEIYYQKALHRARSRGRSSVRWLFYCLKAAAALDVFSAEGNTTTIGHLTGEQLRSHRFPFPDRVTQNRIVSELDEVTEHVRQLNELFVRQVQMLTERRQALVTAAVNGEIDVEAARGAGV
ncbi:restriction endonuclease subunit S [Micromonospora sp. NPDC000663]|uniref:restriction endonuclease subunit S n=1 Tax=Micromonospora sp. NPDC000663 TaxID=3364218 RepID=UPI00368B9E70